MEQEKGIIVPGWGLPWTTTDRRDILASLDRNMVANFAALTWCGEPRLEGRLGLIY